MGVWLNLIRTPLTPNQSLMVTVTIVVVFVFYLLTLLLAELISVSSGCQVLSF